MKNIHLIPPADYVEFVYLMERSDLILTNRWHDDLADVRDKVYTRDLFGTG